MANVVDMTLNDH